jgi:glutamyl-tRNA reductase
MLESAVNRLLHQPTIRLRQAAIERSQDALSLEQLSSAINELFGFDAETEAVSATENALPEADVEADNSGLSLAPNARAAASRN